MRPCRLPLPPGSTIGILGGGQLGRMLALAAARLGFDVAVLEREADSRRPAAWPPAPWSRRLRRPGGAGGAGRRLPTWSPTSSRTCRPPRSAGWRRWASRSRPGRAALAVAQDRVEEKTFLNAHGAPTVGLRRRRHAPRRPPRAVARHRRAGPDEDPPRGLRRQGPALGRARRRRRRRLRGPGRRAGDRRGRRRLRARAVGDRRPRPRRRDRRSIRWPRTTTRAASCAARIAPARRRRRPWPTRPSGSPRAILAGLDYVGVIGIELFEMRRRPAAGERDRAPGAQHRPLDAGRLRGRPVRAAHPRRRRLAAGPDPAPSPRWRC